MLKVAKFGGSSMADAGQYEKVRSIIRADDARKVVVVSAAGKRNGDDHKITDLLYLCYAHLQYGVDCSGVFGMLFVCGPEDFSRGRFVFMSLLPNLAFGFLPYAVGLIFPSLGWLGLFGAFCIGAGAGDYYNVFNALTQMPRGARAYMYGLNTYWYMP